MPNFPYLNKGYHVVYLGYLVKLSEVTQVFSIFYMAFLAILLLYTKIGGNLKKSIFYIDKMTMVTSLIGYHLKNPILKYF